MRIFVTGASGWIGSATVSELLESGHEVVGLARSDASAQRLEEAGAVVHRGDLDEPDGLAKAAADSDGVIHLAFQHEIAFGGDFRRAAAAADRRAVEAMGAALAGWYWPLVLASGLLGLAARTGCDRGRRPGAQRTGEGHSRRAPFRDGRCSRCHSGGSVCARRCSGSRPLVHGDGETASSRTFVAIARQRGVAGYVGDGIQPLARGAPLRCRSSRPAGCRVGARRLGPARRRRRGCPLPRDRRSDGPFPQCPDRVGDAGAGRGRATSPPSGISRGWTARPPVP